MAPGRSCCNYRVFLCFVAAATIAIFGLLGLLKPLSNDCKMTFMYPNYIPVPLPVDRKHNKYGVYLYHEGWKRVDHREHLSQLSGVPVLFIPGNGGSFKQVSNSSGPNQIRMYLEPFCFLDRLMP